MNENGRKRREWVKTAAIIFLSVMLVLTFFSQTIMNYSLPEVAVQYVESGSITAKIRGTGVVESGDPYNVEVKESRKVQSVAVRVGDAVQKGDILLYLEDTESEELKAAKEALEAAQDAYDLALLSADVSAELIQEAGSNVSTSSYRQQITDAQNAVKAEQKKVDEWQAQYDKLSTQISVTPGNNANVESETKAFQTAKTNLESKQFTLTEAENLLKKIEAQLQFEISISSGDAVIANLTTQQQDAQKKVNEATSAVADAQLAYDKAKTALDNKTASGDTSGTIANLQSQQNTIKINLDAATKVLNEKQDALTALLARINGVLGLQDKYEAIVDAQNEVSEQLAKTENATVTAGISGTVSALNVTAGQTTSVGTPVVVLQPEGKGYYMSFTVTNEQAKRLSVGDRADLVNSWRYDGVEVKLSSIKPDPQNPGQQKLLTFDISGDVMAGQTLNVSVGDKSANYDLIVPNSAIREDNNGKFVLSVESKPSPLGNRYIATRVDVEVLASDDTKSAISGALNGWEYIITTSTKPVEAGKQVRLADN